MLGQQIDFKKVSCMGHSIVPLPSAQLHPILERGRLAHLENNL